MQVLIATSSEGHKAIHIALSIGETGEVMRELQDAHDHLNFTPAIDELLGKLSKIELVIDG